MNLAGTPQLDFAEIARLVNTNYGVEVWGEIEELNERDGQRVLKCNILDGKPLIVRLCVPIRRYERVLSDTGALLRLSRGGFPVPHLRLTVKGERIFQWQTGCWAYVLDYIEGEQPEMDLPTLNYLAGLLAEIHDLVHTTAEYPALVNWLEELPVSIERAERSSLHPQWGKIAREVADNLRSLPDLSVLPLGLIHTDVHEGNMLRTSDGELFLIDWEDAGLGEMVFDMALVLGWNCVWPKNTFISLFGSRLPDRYDFDEEYSCAFLRAYQKVRKLGEQEVNLLGAAIRFVMGWFAARDIEREIISPGISDGLAITNWAIMRSVTPLWERKLAQWAVETAG
ncbi:phosphotransferase [Candidatus Chlorohelix sp.]|uniref:phosphotransferase enzyme family protein n=1 Tax=Candidatus Chlorohelix sp. TaxID=3139201 RepID=UPI00306C22E2